MVTALPKPAEGKELSLDLVPYNRPQVVFRGDSGAPSAADPLATFACVLQAEPRPPLSDEMDWETPPTTDLVNLANQLAHT